MHDAGSYRVAAVKTPKKSITAREYRERVWDAYSMGCDDHMFGIDCTNTMHWWELTRRRVPHADGTMDMTGQRVSR